MHLRREAAGGGHAPDLAHVRLQLLHRLQHTDTMACIQATAVSSDWPAARFQVPPRTCQGQPMEEAMVASENLSRTAWASGWQSMFSEFSTLKICVRHAHTGRRMSLPCHDAQRMAQSGLCVWRRGDRNNKPHRSQGPGLVAMIGRVVWSVGLSVCLCTCPSSGVRSVSLTHDDTKRKA